MTSYCRNRERRVRRRGVVVPRADPQSGGSVAIFGEVGPQPRVGASALGVLSYRYW